MEFFPVYFEFLIKEKIWFRCNPVLLYPCSYSLQDLFMYFVECFIVIIFRMKSCGIHFNWKFWNEVLCNAYLAYHCILAFQNLSNSWIEKYLLHCDKGYLWKLSPESFRLHASFKVPAERWKDLIWLQNARCPLKDFDLL